MKIDLMSRALGRQGREADDVGQEDGDAVERLRLRNLTFLHLTQNLTRQKIGQKFLRFLLFLSINFNAVVVHLGKSANTNETIFTSFENIFVQKYICNVEHNQRNISCSA